MSSTVNNDLNDALVEKAVKSLLKYETKRIEERDSNSLMGGYAKPILVQIHLNKPIKSPIIRPVRVAIPNSLFDIEGEEHSVCLFCRSCDKEEIERQLESSPIEGVTKVVSIDQVKKHYKQFNDKKKLLAEHTNFVCDTRIFSQLINLLGKVFTRRNNHPIPIEFSNLDKLESAVNKAVHNSTYMHVAGQVITLRLGYTNMSPQKVVGNVLAGVRVAVEKLDVGVRLGGVHSIHIKSSDSAALPIHFSYKSDIGDFVASQVSGDESKTPKKKPKKATAVVTPAPDPISSAASFVLALDGKKKKVTSSSGAAKTPAVSKTPAASVPKTPATKVSATPARSTRNTRSAALEDATPSAVKSSVKKSAAKKK